MTLLSQIESADCQAPRLWWLGGSSFAVKYQGIVFYIDPRLSGPAAPLDPGRITHAHLALCTQAGALDADTLGPLLAASPRAKLVIPKSQADAARARGVAFDRMTTTDADLRIEYFLGGVYGRVYAVPSGRRNAAGEVALDWTPIGGYPYLGYLVRFGACTIYHSGECAYYDGVVDRLRPYNVTVALLAVNGSGFQAAEAAQLARDIGACWLAPMDADDFDPFVEHLLGHRPEQRFKIFKRGEGWTIPAD